MTVSDVTLTLCDESQYIRLRRMHYRQNDESKSWDIALVHDSVAVLLYHRERDALILVRQFRPAVYLKNGDGFTYELCAGIVDKEKDLAMIAAEEIEEECGYRVAPGAMMRITSFYTSVGFAGSVQTLYYAEVDETMRVNEGGGIDGEAIELVYLPRARAASFVTDESRAKTPGLMYAFGWFLARGS